MARRLWATTHAREASDLISAKRIAERNLISQPRESRCVAQGRIALSVCCIPLLVTTRTHVPDPDLQYGVPPSPHASTEHATAPTTAWTESYLITFCDVRRVDEGSADGGIEFAVVPIGSKVRCV